MHTRTVNRYSKQSASGGTLDDAVWTVLRLLEWTTDYLARHGSTSARLDAEVLLSQALACSRIDLYTSYDQTATDAQRDTFRSLVRQRAAGAPVAYLVGEREFYSRLFSVNPSVLIPRPESEFVILELLDLLAEQPVASPTIVDVGTGSGALAIIAALEVKNSRVFAFDNSPESLELASSNADRHGVTDRLQLICSDLLSQLPGNVTPDIIISNPPYVSEAEWQALDVTVRDFEPRVALVGGPTGTEVIRRLIPEAAARLRPTGALVVEVSPMIAGDVTRLIDAAGVFEVPRIRQDLEKRARVISARVK